MKKTLCAITGAFLWGVLVFAGYHMSGRLERTLMDTVGKELKVPTEAWIARRSKELKYLMNPVEIEIVFDSQVWISSGDKLYLSGRGMDSEFSSVEPQSEIGVVWAISEDRLTRKWIVFARIYPDFVGHIGPNTTCTLIALPRDFGWILKKLLKPRMEELKQELNRYMEAHAKELKRQFLPELSAILKESYELLKEKLPGFLETRKDDFKSHLGRIKTEEIDEELTEVQKIIWPLLVAEYPEVVKPILNRMWERLPKWKLGVAWVEDQFSDDKTHVQAVLEVYLKQEVLTILKSEEKSLKDATTRVLKKSWENQELRKAINGLVLKILHDEKFIEFLRQMVLEFYKENEEVLIAKFRTRWNSPEFQDKLKQASGQFEPTLISIINTVARESGKKDISADFASVLRRQIFFKDRYSIVMTSTCEPWWGAMGSTAQYSLHLFHAGYPRRFSGK